MFPKELNKSAWTAEITTMKTLIHRHLKSLILFVFLFSFSRSCFSLHLHEHYRHRFSHGKRIVRLKMIACLFPLPCLQDFLTNAHIIVIHCSGLLICMAAALLPAQGQEIGPQQGAKCAFNLNKPFNLSSITWKQLRALILLQFKGNNLELTSMRTAVKFAALKSCDREQGLARQFPLGNEGKKS